MSQRNQGAMVTGSSIDASRPWHCCLFVPSFRGGGAERVMVTLANAFAARGHRVDLVVAQNEGPYTSDVSDAVTVVDLNKSRVLKAIPDLRRYFRHHKPDAVMATMTHTNAICALSLWLSGHDARLVLREANEPTPNADARERLLHRLARYPYRRADAVVSVSPATRDAIRQSLRLSPDLPMPVIDNPAVTAELLAQSLHTPEPPLPEGDGPLILGVGRLMPAKGFASLIQAFARVRARRPARLLILGEGPLRATLEAQVQEAGLTDSVWMPGFVGNPFAWMAVCDVFVLSSLYEGSPNSLIQAVACGSEVVATRLPGSTDVLLDNGRYGRLVEPEDVSALTQAIAGALDAPLRPDMQAWRQRYASDAIVDRYEALLNGDPSVSPA